MTTHLASRIRECVDLLHPTNPDIGALRAGIDRAEAELLRLAVQVERQELALDELVADARRELTLEPFRRLVAETRLGQHR